MPGMASRVSRWLAEYYYSVQRGCTKEKALPRFLYPFMLLLGITFLALFLLIGAKLDAILVTAGYTLLGVFLTVACYTRLRGFAASLVGLLLPLQAVLWIVVALLVLV